MKKISALRLKKIIKEELKRVLIEARSTASQLHESGCGCDACAAAVDYDDTYDDTYDDRYYDDDMGDIGCGDVDWEGPGSQATAPRIEDLDPMEAFALGFQMGQSGEFDDEMEDDVVMLEKKKSSKKKKDKAEGEYPYYRWWSGAPAPVGRDYHRDSEDVQFDASLGMDTGFGDGGGE